MRLILARNKAEAWEHIKPGDKYLAILPDDLFGHADCDLLEVGNYWARPDFKIEEIYYYCVSHNISMSPKLKLTINAGRRVNMENKMEDLNRPACKCKFAPYKENNEESWHYLRTCKKCGEDWYGLHCPHDGYQNPCPQCGYRPAPERLETDSNRPTCPTCLKPMARGGTVLSGRRRCQRYKCSWCGYVKVDTKAMVKLNTHQQP